VSLQSLKKSFGLSESVSRKDKTTLYRRENGSLTEESQVPHSALYTRKRRIEDPCFFNDVNGVVVLGYEKCPDPEEMNPVLE